MDAPAVELAPLRLGSVGIIGYPLSLGDRLDTNGNGVVEFVVARRNELSIVEEEAGPRGLREVARFGPRGSAVFRGALLIDRPSGPPDLLLRWSDRVELRALGTLAVTATHSGNFDSAAAGDVDGDGVWELLLGRQGTVRLLEAGTLVLRGTVSLPGTHLAVADLGGDARAEVVTQDARAFTLSENGGQWTAAEVWNAGLAGEWVPHVLSHGGRPAIALQDTSGFSLLLATLHPAPALRPLADAGGAPFKPLFADADGDGDTDLILATDQVLRAIDLGSGATLWQRNTLFEAPPLTSVYAPAVLDLDRDGRVDVIWADAGAAGGLLAATVPVSAGARWRTDARHGVVRDWDLQINRDGSRALAYLSGNGLGNGASAALGFLAAPTLLDRSGTAYAWHSTAPGDSAQYAQHAIAALPQEPGGAAAVVAGASFLPGSGVPQERVLWWFDATGRLLAQAARASTATIARMRLASRQDAEPTLLLALAESSPAGVPAAPSARVEAVDPTTGQSRWLSAPVTSQDGATVSGLDSGELDREASGPEVVLGFGTTVAVFSPAIAAAPLATFPGTMFSLLPNAEGEQAILAVASGRQVALHAGIGAPQRRTLTLAEDVFAIALVRRPWDPTLLLAASHSSGIALYRVRDGQRVGVYPAAASERLSVVDANGDGRVDLVALNNEFAILEFSREPILHSGFEPAY